MNTSTSTEGEPAPPGGPARVALVTGGSRGIGRAISERLARTGHAVAINYLNDAETAQDLAARLRAEGHVAEPVRGDVTDPASVRRTLARTAELFGAAPAVLVNNVGEFSLSQLHDTSVERWKRIIDSNLNSAFYVTHEALPAMRRQRYGRIVFIGMAQALLVRGAPSVAAYAVAKTGITVLTRSLAVEEAPYGITVNCVAPGLVDNGYLPPEQAGWMRSQCPSGRMGVPEDIANTVEFVISARAGYLAGATISVSGGWEWENRQVEHNGAVRELFAEDAVHG
jgi:NAD(P)-dependent dehydrogenase (short-subunit alcohol dehydrogenase family)